MPADFVIFKDVLNEKLKDPEFKKRFEEKEEKFELEMKINELLQDTGNGHLRFELVEEDD